MKSLFIILLSLGAVVFGLIGLIGGLMDIASNPFHPLHLGIIFAALLMVIGGAMGIVHQAKKS